MRRKSTLEVQRSPSLKWNDKHQVNNVRNANINSSIDKRSEETALPVSKNKTNERTLLPTPRSVNKLPKSPQWLNEANPHSSDRLHISNELQQSTSPNWKIISKLTTNDKLRLCGIRPGTTPARLFLKSQLAKESRQNEYEQEDEIDGDDNTYEPVESRQNKNNSNTMENIRQANNSRKKLLGSSSLNAAANADKNDSVKVINAIKEKEKNKLKISNVNESNLSHNEGKEEGIIEVQKASTQELSSAKAKLSIQDMVQSNPEQYSKWHNKNRLDLPCPRVVVLSLNSHAKNKSSNFAKPEEQTNQHRPYLYNETNSKAWQNQEHSSHHDRNNLPPLLDRANFQKLP